MHKTIASVALAALIGIFASCGKQSKSSNETAKQASETNLKSLSPVEFDPNNPLNKEVFASIGQMHNELVEFGYSDYGTSKNIYQLADEFNGILNSKGIHVETDQSDLVEYFHKTNGEINSDIYATLNGLRSRADELNQDSTLFNAKIDRLISLFNYLESNSNDVQSALDLLDQYEIDIDNLTITTDEKVSIYCSIYVLRSSLNFWNEKLSDKAKCTICVALWDAGTFILTLPTGPWNSLGASAALSLFASFCVCKKCKTYGNVGCH